MYHPDSGLLKRGSRRAFEQQMLKHMFAHFLLWFIARKPVHGYDIIKTLEAEEGLRLVTASKLYPILKDLTRKGLIAQEKEMQGRRARKIYHVTAKGMDAIKEAKRYMHTRPIKRQFLKEMVD
ncbi:MAG: PadR family transcriptional regulator [Candidatus Micrarchaeia archaeon]